MFKNNSKQTFILHTNNRKNIFFFLLKNVNIKYFFIFSVCISFYALHNQWKHIFLLYWSTFLHTKYYCINSNQPVTYTYNILQHNYNYNNIHRICHILGSWVHPGEYASSGRYQTSYLYGFIYITCKYLKHQI